MAKRKKGKGTQPYKGKGEGVINEEIRADEKAKYEDQMSVIRSEEHTSELQSLNSDRRKCSLAQSLFEYSEDSDGKHSISRSASAVRSCVLLISVSFPKIIDI